MKIKKTISILKNCAILAALATGLTVQAQTLTWTNYAGGSWATIANWTNSSGANQLPSGPGVTADFSELILGGSRIVTLDGVRTVGNMIFGDQGNAYNWALTTGTGGPLTLQVGSGSPTITVNTGTATNSEVLTGSQGMTKMGAGNLVLTSDETYSGGTTVNNGTVILTAGGGTGTLRGALTINAGGSVVTTVQDALGYSSGVSISPLTINGGNFTNTSGNNEGYITQWFMTGGNVASTGGAINFSAGYGITTFASSTLANFTAPISLRSSGIGITNALGTVPGGVDMYAGGVISGSGENLIKAGPGNLSMGAVNTYSGSTLVLAGILTLANGGSAGTIGSSAIIVTNGAELDLNASDALGYSSASTLTVYGTVKKLNNQAETLYRPITLINGTFTNALTSAQAAYELFGNYIATAANTTNWITGPGQFGLRTGTAYFTNAPGSVLNVSAAIYPYSSGCPLNKMGAGKMVLLSANNFYNGNTVINGGTLEVDGVISNSAVAVNSGATLDGSGIIGGAVTVQSGGTLQVGTTVATGTLTISNSLILSSGSTNIMRLSKNGGIPATDLLQGMTALTYGGTLIVTNITSDANVLAAGDTFQLFSSAVYNGAFTTFVLPALPTGLSWNSSLLPVNGTISVISGSTPPAFTPPGGGYVGSVSVTISSDAGSTIYYTTDGSTPTLASAHAASPVTGLVVPVSTTEIITAFATNTITHANGSPVVSATYATVPTAVWTNLAGGTWSVAPNWNEGAVGNASGVTADFSQLTLTGNTTVSMSSAETIGTMLFEDQGNAFGWTLSGGPLTMNNGTLVPSIVVSNQGVNISATLAGTNGLAIYGKGLGVSTMILSSANNSFTNLFVSGISVTNSTAAGSTTLDLGAKVAASTITVNSNAVLTFTINNIFGGGGMTNATLPTLVINGEVTSTRYNALPNVVLNGGILDQSASDTGTYHGYQFIGTVTVGGASASTISSGPAASTGVYDPDQLLNGNGTTFNVAVTGAAGPDLTVSCALTNSSGDYGNGPGALVKTGPGTMALAAGNYYTGSTTVSNGTLEVDGNPGTGSGTVTIKAGGILDGTGYITGAVLLNGGTLSAGNAANLGSLSLATALSLSGGTTALRINNNNGNATADSVQVQNSQPLAYGGTLTVTNTTSDGTQLVAGETFTLFSASTYSGVFSTLNLPTLSPGLFWDTSGLTVNGTIAVTANAPTPVFNPTPGGYVGTVAVKISSAPGSTIYYTTDGTDPASSPTALSSPTPATVVVPANTPPSEAITAYASLPAGNSVETTAYYTTADIPTWENSSGGNWSNTGNWTNEVVANGINETADFSTLNLNGADATVTLDIAPVVGNLVFGDQANANNWWVAPTGVGPLVLNVSSGSPTITVNNQTTYMLTSLTGTNGLVKAGSGTLVLSNTCPYTGNTIVNGGNLVLGTNYAGIGTIDGTLTVNKGATATAVVPNALGYTNTTNPHILWVQTLNLFGGAFVGLATNNDEGFALTINMMGGTILTSNGCRIAAGSGTVVNTVATNVPSVIAGIFQARENNPSNQIPFNVASSGGVASPDLLVSALIGNQTAGVGIVKNGAGVMGLTAANSFSGATIVSNGVLQLLGGGGALGSLSNSPVTVEQGAELQTFTGDGLGYAYNATRTLTLNGGTLREINTNSETLGRPITMIGGVITASPGAGLYTNSTGGSVGDCYNLFNSTAIVATAPGTTNYINLTTNQYFALRGGSFSNAANAYLIVNAVLDGWGGGSGYALTVTGPGTMILNSNNIYPGSTSLSGGNLEVDGSIAGGSGTVMVSGGILDGNGAINGQTIVASGGTLMAGTVSSMGTLSISNVLTFSAGGTNVMRISKNNNTPVSDHLQGLAPVTYGGTLVVTNVTSDGSQFAVGDTFQLFSSSGYAGAFAAYVLPSLPNGLWSWDTSQLNVNGTIRVINGTGTPTFSPAGGNYVGTVSVTISSDAGSTIFYTTDGSTPSTSSAHGASPLSGIIVPVSTTETIKAFATNSGTSASLMASATYVTVPTAIWTNVAGGAWPTPDNWNLNVVGNGSGITADFSTLTLNSNITVTLSGSQTIGAMLFGDQGNAHSWLLTGSGSLTIDAGLTVPSIVVNNQGITNATVMAGTNGVIKAGAGTLSLTAANSYSGTTVVSAGVLQLAGSGGALGTISNSPVIVQSGAEVQVAAGDVLGYTYNPVRTLTLNGGTLREVSSNSETLGRPITMINGTITANPGDGATGSTVLGDSYNLFNSTAVVSTAPNTTNYINLPAGNHFALRGGSFSNAANSYLVANAVLDGWGGGAYGLTMSGPGTMILSSNNTYLGLTVISNGTLLVEGSISNGQVTVYGGTLQGNGSIAADVEVYNGATLAAGVPGTIGTLTINNTLEMSGTAALRISKTGGVLTSDNVVSTGGITYGGTLSVANVTSDSHALANGDTFTLFTTTAYGGAFTATNLPALPSGLGWSWNPATGVLSVVPGPVTLSGLAFTASPVISGTTLTISATNTGGGTVYLLSSTNLAAPYVSWTPVWTNVLSGSGSFTTNLLNAVNPANAQQFYLLSNTP